MPLHYRGHTALVTGAASGIGRATAERLASTGIRVIMVDRDPELEQVVGELVASGRDAVALSLDIVEEAGVSEGLERVGAEGLAYVVNCAGVHGQFSFDDITTDEWHRVLDINLLGAFAVTRAAARWMRECGSGAVVNITSVEASRVVALINPVAVPHYAASKAALEMLTRSMAHALAPDAIRVNAVAPGFVSTPMSRGNHATAGFPAQAASRTLIQRYAVPDEIAAAVCFLLSDEASFITATTLNVEGGYLSV